MPNTKTAQRGPHIPISYRQLHQNAVHGRVGVELSDGGQHVLLRGFRRQLARKRRDTALGARFVLHGDVGARVLAVSDDDDGEARDLDGGWGLGGWEGTDLGSGDERARGRSGDGSARARRRPHLAARLLLELLDGLGDFGADRVGDRLAVDHFTGRARQEGGRRERGRGGHPAELAGGGGAPLSLCAARGWLWRAVRCETDEYCCWLWPGVGLDRSMEG